MKTNLTNEQIHEIIKSSKKQYEKLFCENDVKCNVSEVDAIMKNFKEVKTNIIKALMLLDYDIDTSLNVTVIQVASDRFLVNLCGEDIGIWDSVRNTFVD